MSKKQIGSDYVQTDSKSRVKLHKSGKSWVKTTLTSMGLLHLFRGAKTEERVLDTDLDLEAGFSSTHWFKGAAALGALVGGAAVTNTAYAAETSSTLPVTSEVATTGTTQVDSTVVASASVSDTTSASASQSVSESQSLLASASMSQSESLSTSQSTSTSTASTSGTSTVSTSTSSSQSTSTSDSAVLAPKANTLTSATNTLAATGTVNNNLVTVTSATLTDTDSSDGFLYPHNGETMEYKATFTVDNTATAGDQFTMVYSPYVMPSDFDMAAFTPVDITDTAGEVIATGTWDATTKTVTYTFTTYVDKYTNVVASIDAFAYVDRAKVPNNTTNTTLPITYSFGGETISKTETITYQTPIVEGSSSIQSIYNELSSTNNTVEQIFYVNPMNYYAYSTTFDLYGYIPADIDGTVSQEGSTIISPSTTTIQVYNAGTGTTLPDSMKITDYSTLTQVSSSIIYGTDSASIFLGDISDVYVIRVVTQFDPTSPDSIISAGVMSSYDSLENKYYVESDNNIVYSEDTSGGTGELTYSVGDYVWFDANQDGLQTTGESPVANVLVTLKFPDGTQKAVYTDANGHYQFDGLSDQTTYTITFTAPSGYAMTTSNVGTNDTLDSDGSSVTFTINGANNMTIDAGLIPDPTSVSISNSMSNSAVSDSISNSKSDSAISESISNSKSDSAVSESISNSKSDSAISDSISNSKSDSAISESISNSKSDSAISESISNSKSDSAVSESISNSKSDSAISESISNSKSDSAVSESISNSKSDSAVSDSISNSKSDSAISDSISNSKSDSAVSESISNSKSDSAVSDSISNSKSDSAVSESISNSKSDSAVSDSISNSKSDSAISESISNSKSDSAVSESISNSKSDSAISESISNSKSDSAISDSISNSKSDSAVSESISNSKSDSAVSESISNSKSDSAVSESISNSKSDSAISDSISNSKSDSAVSESISNSKSDSAISDSISNSKSDSAVSESTSISNSVSVSDSTSLSDSVSTSDSISVSESSSLSTSISESTSIINSETSTVYTIGDTVWEDTNKDGIQDAGEPGIPGVTVTLTNPDGSTVTTTTDANGHYEFTDLPNGDYTVTFETPNGYTPTTSNTGDDTKDSDGQVVKVTVDGSDNPTIDSGFVKETYTIGDTVWEDTNKDGIQDAGEPGIPGVTVTLTNPDGTTVTTTTDANGYYEFTGLNDGDTYTVTFETPAGYVPTTANVGDDSLDSDGSSVTVTINGADDVTLDSGFVKEVHTIGDTVWEDTNKDGIQDAGEPGIPGVTVTLTNPDGTTETTTTDANGYYEFTELNDGDTYTVTFETPAGYVPTTANVGDDSLDSDGSSVTVTINGADDVTLDSGFVKEVHTIGDTVWEDTNKDGIQDAGEPGIPGVTVTLTNPDGTTVTTTTDANGHYEFTDLPNGDYTVTFETPNGYTPTRSNTGDDTKDSDGQVVKVTVAGSDNPTIDSGFVKVEQPTPGSNSSSESLSQSTTQSSSQSSSAKPVASQTAAQLPHTGQAENNGLYGSAALAILAALGLAGKKRNEND